MNYQLCKEFPSFTPFDIEREKYNKVISLYANVRKLQIRESEHIERNKNPQTIRRPAGDDWF